MPKRKVNRELVKLPVSTSIPAFHLHRLEAEVEESKGRETLASLTRAILMDHVEKRETR